MVNQIKMIHIQNVEFNFIIFTHFLLILLEEDKNNEARGKLS